jgi:hypothetical protein
MSESEAISIIEKVCADFRGTLMDHKAIQEAVVLIKRKLEAANTPAAPSPQPPQPPA